MTELGARIQRADWKKEKHVPVIEAPDQVKGGELFDVKVSLGAEARRSNWMPLQSSLHPRVSEVLAFNTPCIVTRRR